MELREAWREVGIATIHGQRVLHQIVGADAEEVHVAHERIAGNGRSGCLDHDAERNVVTERYAPFGELLNGLADKLPRFTHFVDRDHQGQHDAQVAMHASPQQGPQLHLEQFTFVEAHADGTPSEKRIRFRGKSADGQLVAAHVEGADDDRAPTEGLKHLPIGLVLLFFVGHGGAPDDEEFSAHEPHPVRTGVGPEFSLVGDVDVGANDDAHTVAGDRFAVREFPQLTDAPGLDLHAMTRLLDLVFGGRDHERAVGTVENGDLPGREECEGVAQAHDGGESERARQNGDVRGGGAGFGRDRGDARAIKLHGERGREIVCHQDRIRTERHVHRIVVGQLKQNGEHANMHVREIADFLAEHRRGVPGEMLAPLEQDQIKCFFGTKVLANERFGTAGELAVVEDGQLHVEDGGLFGTGLHFGAGAHVAKALPRPLEALMQPTDLGVDRVILNEAMLHLGHLPAQEVHRSHDDSRRGGNAAED